MKRLLPVLHLSIISMMLISAAGCNLPVTPTPTPAVQPTLTPTPAPTPAPTNTPNPLLVKLLNDNTALIPRVVNPSNALSSKGPVLISFDQSMDKPATEAAWSFTDQAGKAVDGKLSWDTPAILRFIPSTPLKEGLIYQVEIKTGAKSSQGSALEEPLRIKFDVTGDLKVTQVFPTPDASGVDNKSVITVLFNRSVVPLTPAEDQSKLPIPIQITPAVSGHGEWVNTSVFTYHPDQALKSGAAYTVLVKAGLASASGGDGSVLAQDTTWNFTTIAPTVDFVQLGAVDTSTGAGKGEYTNSQPQVDIPLDATFSVSFHQAMDTASVAKVLQVLTNANQPAPIDLKWNKDNTLVQVSMRGHLAYGTSYTLSIPTTAQAAGGGELDKPLAWPFTTVQSPAILFTDPANNSSGDIKYSFSIKFSSPMKLDTLADKVVFSPPLKATSLPGDQRYIYNDYDHSLIFFGLDPSTTYNVTVQPGMSDLYGKTIDARVGYTFTTGPRQPWIYMLMPYQAYYRADGPKDFYVQYVNIDKVTFNLFKLSEDQLSPILKYADPATWSVWNGKPVWSATETNAGKLDEIVLKKFTLGAGNKTPLAPGAYVLASESPSVVTNSNFRYFDVHLLVVASASLTFKSSDGESLLWLTDMTSGKPLAGVPLKVFDNNYTALAQGTTDANGLLHVTIPPLALNSYVSFAASDDPGHYAFAELNWGSGVSPYQFGISEAYYNLPLPYKAYVYTERPVYRPGQPVYFKGILRLDDDLKYTLPDQNKVHVTIESFKDQVYDEMLDVSPYGTFDGKFTLDANAALGAYTIKVLPPGPQSKDNPQLIASLNFSVAEYRRPEFTVAVNAQPANLLNGDKFNASVTASYFSGGSVGGSSVNWTLSAVPFTFTPPDQYTAYSFSDLAQDSGDLYRSPQVPDSAIIAQGQGKTDDAGTFSVSLPATLDKNGNGQILTFEATLTDQAGNTVSGRSSVTAHQSSVYVGVKPGNYVGTAGQDTSFDLIAMDWLGAIQPGAKVDVDIIERQWFSVQQQDAQGNLTWSTSVKDVPVTGFKDQVADKDGKLKVNFIPQHGGIYLARGTIVDTHGNTAHASAYIWVAGSDYIAWRQTNDRSFQLVADQTQYKPGDTAQILIASPFQGESYALVTVERGHTRKAEVVHLTSNSTVYPLPVTADMAPNVFVDVTIIKGVDQTNPRPSFKVGMVKIKVSTDAQTINVSLKVDKTSAAPGDKVTYQVQTTDAQGKGVKAEVSLGLSDLATLTLAAPNSGSLLDYFYAPRDLGVATAVSIVSSAEEYNAALTPAAPAGGRGGSGGGKGSGYLGVMEIRQNFPDTAFWQAHLVTGDDGKASVSVTLPDNLTTWRMDARAVTGDTRVGQVTNDLISSKPLLVLPQTPRFFVVGDTVNLGADVHNNTDQDLDISATLTAQGISLSGSQTQSIKISAHHQGFVTWQGVVNPDATRVDLVFGAASGDYRDASAPTAGTLDSHGIPVYRFTAEEVVGTAGQLNTGGARAEALDLPQSWGVTQGSVILEMQPSLAASWTDGLTFLKNPEYDSTEALISSFLPNVLTTQALKAAGMSSPDLEANLKQQVNLAVQRLVSQQKADGGWGWWPNIDSNPLVTAYVAQGLVEAKQAGYAINDDSLNKALVYLTGSLKSLQTLSPRQDLNRQAFLLYVLALCGQPDPSHAGQLFDARQNLNLYARSYLALTLTLIDPKDARLATLLSDLNSAAITSATGVHWEENSNDTWNWNTDLRTTAIVLDTLVQLNPGGDLNANVVRWLMHNRAHGYWGSTQETAWSLIALTDWIKQTGELQANYEYAAAFNGQEIGSGKVTADSLRQVVTLRLDVNNLLTDQANKLVIARTDGPGSLYYTAHLDVYLPVDKISALDRGFSVSRQYFNPADLKTPVTSAKQSDVVLVRLTVVVPDERQYVIVDDPLPAGLEAVDTSLNTSQQSLNPAEYDWNKLSSEGYGWWYFDHIEIKDAKVLLTASYLPAGTYVYTYYARAVTPGSFHTIPPTVKELYFPEVYGRGDGSLFEVKAP